MRDASLHTAMPDPKDVLCPRIPFALKPAEHYTLNTGPMKGPLIMNAAGVRRLDLSHPDPQNM
jgi:hypothetical protein